jgi:hypothetical protein
MRAFRASVLTKIGSTAAVAVLATGAVMATGTAANAAKGHAKAAATTLSIKNKVVAHSRHHVDALTGVLRAHRKGVAGETITLESRTGKKPRWAAAGSATTGATGAVTFTVDPSARTQYKLVFAGDSSYRKSHSNVITLKAIKTKK